MPDVVDEQHKAAEHAAGQPLNNVARELRNVKAELGNDIANSKELEEFLREFGPDNEQA
jgi:aminoglycoside phosphotransferase (APT) family kinase protein